MRQPALRLAGVVAKTLAIAAGIGTLVTFLGLLVWGIVWSGGLVVASMGDGAQHGNGFVGFLFLLICLVVLTYISGMAWLFLDDMTTSED